MSRLRKSGEVSAHAATTPERIWAIVADVTRVGEWSHECRSAAWIDGATTAAVRARFVGGNSQRGLRWRRVNEIEELVAPRRITWRTIPTLLYPDSTRWSIELQPAGDGGTTIVQRYEVLRIPAFLDWLYSIILPAHRDRTEALTADLQRLAAVATNSTHHATNTVTNS